MSENEYKKLDKESVIEDYDKGMSIVDCAEKYGCCQETIRRRLARWGVKLRTKSEAHKLFHKSEKGKKWSKKRSDIQKQNYKEMGQEMFSKKFRNNIGSWKNNPIDTKGKNNGRWKGGRSDIYWRNQVIGKNGEKCQECGWDDVVEVLEAHHIDFNRENSLVDNGKVLCPNCHRIIHFKERGFK